MSPALCAILNKEHKTKTVLLNTTHWASKHVKESSVSRWLRNVGDPILQENSNSSCVVPNGDCAGADSQSRTKTCCLTPHWASKHMKETVSRWSDGQNFMVLALK